jgi:hypothetical protein
VRTISSRKPVWIFIHNIILLYLICEHSVCINSRTKYKILGFSFDLNVSIRLYLVEPSGGSDSENTLPCCSSSQIVVKLTSELETEISCLKFLVVVEASRAFSSQISKCLQVFVLVLTVGEDVEIA